MVTGIIFKLGCVEYAASFPRARFLSAASCGFVRSHAKDMAAVTGYGRNEPPPAQEKSRAGQFKRLRWLVILRKTTLSG